MIVSRAGGSVASGFVLVRLESTFHFKKTQKA